MTTTKLFEFPVNQHYRDYLRIEAALNQIRNMLATSDLNQLQACLLYFNNLLTLLNRFDVKSEIIKTLEIQQQIYSKLVSNPAVDSKKLQQFLKQIEKLHGWAVNHRGRIGDHLRNERIVALLNQKNSIQTGIESADCPELFLFCNQQVAEIKKHIEQWLQNLEGLDTSINVILRLARESASFKKVDAPIGDYIIDDIDSSSTLLRVKVNYPYFPEMSGGKHRISLHFYQTDEQLRKLKIHDKVHFEYALCH